MALNPYVENYSPTFAECRLVGHRWQVADEVPEDVKLDPIVLKAAVPLPLVCQCGMYRIDLVSKRDGQVDARKYVRPKGYLLTREGDTELPKRADWRMGWLDSHMKAIREERKARRGLA